MYRQCKNLDESIANCVLRFSDQAIIPFDPANTDYQQFKSDISNGVELQDPDGNVMTPEQVQEFLSTLP